MHVTLVSNTQMASSDSEQRLIDLEIKIGFMEDMVDSLNQVVARQQQHLDLLVRELTQLRSQVEDSAPSAGFRSLRDELPPHY